VILSAHLAQAGARQALGYLRSRPAPKAIDGLRYAETFLMSPFRTGILPSRDVTGAALIAAWDDDDALDRFLDHPLAKRWEHGWRARLEPVRTVGAWPSLPDLPRQERPTDDEPVAVLTIARVRLARAGAFAMAAGEAERDALVHPAFLAGTSLIRPPNLVATFSLWRNAREMRTYAAGSYPGAHTRAMQAHEERVFHHETVFVRFRPYAAAGQWNGRNPLLMRKGNRPPSPVASDGGDGGPSPVASDGGDGQPSPVATDGGDGRPSPVASDGGDRGLSPVASDGGDGEGQ